jgi:hypothetical protein
MSIKFVFVNKWWFLKYFISNSTLLIRRNQINLRLKQALDSIYSAVQYIINALTLTFLYLQYNYSILAENKYNLYLSLKVVTLIIHI